MSSHTYPVAQQTSRRTLRVSPVKKQYYEDGVRYYETVDGKKYDANIYDTIQVPALKLEVKKRFDVQGSGERGNERRKTSGWAKPQAQTKPVKKKCNKCKEIKNIEYFYKAPNSYDGRQKECISCHRERTKISNKTHQQNKRLTFGNIVTVGEYLE